jgi:hypothetical protein
MPQLPGGEVLDDVAQAATATATIATHALFVAISVTRQDTAPRFQTRSAAWSPISHAKPCSGRLALQFGQPEL